eukprot:818255-Pelagomonas_calceolata.AAC.1
MESETCVSIGLPHLWNCGHPVSSILSAWALHQLRRQQLSCAAILCFLLGLKYSAALASDKTGAGPVLQHIHI